VNPRKNATSVSAKTNPALSSSATTRRNLLAPFPPHNFLHWTAEEPEDAYA
jgi:hypothetical protein